MVTVMLLGVGCSANARLVAPPQDAALDTGSSPDAGPQDAGKEAASGGGDAGRDIADSGDGGNVCPHVVGAADCAASDKGCRPTWTDVLANPICVPGSIDYSREAHFDCGGYHVSVVEHVDTSETYYYDATTGQLVAIYSTVLLQQRCVAGPPSGLTVNCPNATRTQVCVHDAGPDAG